MENQSPLALKVMILYMYSPKVLHAYDKNQEVELILLKLLTLEDHTDGPKIADIM